MFLVRFKIELFASRIPVVKIGAVGIGISLLLRERAEMWFVIHQCEQSLRNLYPRPFHTGIGPGGVSDFVNFVIFKNVQEGWAREQSVLVVLRVCMSNR